jgi:superoxide dismutase, Cu-Zn family
MKPDKILVALGSFALGLFVAAAPAAAQVDDHGCVGMDVAKAKAFINPTAGNQTSGVVTFTTEGDKIRVVADIVGLKPGSSHGFHVHDFGDCSAPDASSAGGHFNPTGHQHAGPPMARHAGDLGNLVADAEGKAHVELVVDNVRIGCGPAMLLGRGVIVHADQDDLKTQPTGNSGPRIACGVIGVSK